MSVKSMTLNEPFIGRVISFPERQETAVNTPKFLNDSAKVLDLEVARIAHIVPAPYRNPETAQAEAHRLRAHYFRWAIKAIADGVKKLTAGR